MPYKKRSDLYKAQKRHRLKIHAILVEFLSSKSCVDCGEKDLRVLDFDHKKRVNKFKSVSRMLAGHYSWKSVKAEIDKCEVRCANCHRRKTYIQLKFFGKTKAPVV